ncbi:MAG: hypothetical protein SXV54_27035 [Chloroflexota bacterium]|nr:hypothetical protein [Chloroflexota bacterium]
MRTSPRKASALFTLALYTGGRRTDGRVCTHTSNAGEELASVVDEILLAKPAFCGTLSRRQSLLEPTIVPPIDNPLKILILSFRRAFAEWLLGAAVDVVEPLNVELPASAVRSDLVFRVVQTDGRQVLLHIEQQGRRSQRPMPWRTLEYMTRLSTRELGHQPPDAAVRLHSVVIYTGIGAGEGDSGRYEVLGIGGTAVLSWQYEPLLLWRMEAEALLELGEPAFLPLVGQMRMSRPEEVVPEVLARIRQVPDEGEKGRLLTALASLMSSEEVLEMVEKMLDPTEEALLDTPYLRRLREQGKEIGLVEGKEIGKEIGLLEGLREAILEAVILHFDPSAMEYRRVNRQLTQLTDPERLRQIHAAAIQAQDMTEFDERLSDILTDAV